MFARHGIRNALRTPKRSVAFPRDPLWTPVTRRTVGPTLGGFLSKPEENFPKLAIQFPILREVAASARAHP